MIESLEQTGAILMILALEERPRFITELIKSAFNPEGVASQQGMNKARKILLRLELIEEIKDEIRPRLYLSLTEKGKAVAEHLKAIQDLLTSP